MPGMMRYRYTTDAGVNYRLRAKSAIIAQQDGALATKVGGAAGQMGDPLPPKGFKPRVAYVTSAAGVTRSVVCYTPDAPLFATDATTITLQSGDADVVFTGNKHNRSEHVPRGIADAS